MCFITFVIYYPTALIGPVPISDSLIIIILGSMVAGAAFYFEKYSIQHPGKKVTARKYLHLVACGSCTISAGLLENLYFLGCIVAVVELFLIWLVMRKNYFSIDGQKSMGIVYFPISFLVLKLLFPSQADRYLIVGPMGFLTLADAMATLIGVKYGKDHFSLTGDRKSMAGTLAFLTAGFIWMILLRLLGFKTGTDWGGYLMISFFLSVLAAATELLGSKGRDNLWVPASTAFMLWAYAKAPVPLDPSQLALCIILFSLAAYLAWRFGLLNASGAVTAVLMGIGLTSFGHFSILPILVFFLSGSLLGKLPGAVASDPKEGRPRDSDQVFSNGGVALVLAYVNCVVDHPVLPLLYLVSVSISSGDTWSSELGQRLSRTAMDLRTMRILPAGLSGCISIPGLLAGMAGSLIIALFAGSLEKATIVFIAGICGGLVDSLLGAFLQARYKDGSAEISDVGRQQISGLRWMNNDLVNISANALVTIATALLVIH